MIFVGVRPEWDLYAETLHFLFLMNSCEPSLERNIFKNSSEIRKENSCVNVNSSPTIAEMAV